MTDEELLVEANRLKLDWDLKFPEISSMKKN
jgi:hypothetical protein